MRGLVCSWLIGVCVIAAWPSAAVGQPPAGQAAEQKKEAPPPPPPEEKPYVRDESRITVSYALALVAVLLILLLVGMPARRE